MLKVKICPQCGQAFSLTAAGLELLYWLNPEAVDEIRYYPARRPPS